jgi:hypothetical protein
MSKSKKQNSVALARVERDVATIDQSKQELEKRREVLALEARLKDLRYIQKLDEVSETILDVLLEDDRLTNYLKKALDSGNVRAIQHILVSLGVTLDKREKLLGYDETRAAQTKKTQFKVLFKGADGSQAGVSVESSG